MYHLRITYESPKNYLRLTACREVFESAMMREKCTARREVERRERTAEP